MLGKSLEVRCSYAHVPFSFATLTIGNLVFMAWETATYFAITLLIEWLLTVPFITSLLTAVHDPGLMDEVEDDYDDVD
jgi:hypothetical protein